MSDNSTITALRALGRGTPYQVARRIMGREKQHDELDDGEPDYEFENTQNLVRSDLWNLFRAGKLERERAGRRGINPPYVYWVKAATTTPGAPARSKWSNDETVCDRATADGQALAEGMGGTRQELRELSLRPGDRDDEKAQGV